MIAENIFLIFFVFWILFINDKIMNLELLQTWIIESIIYSVIWIIIMVLAFLIFEKATKFSTKKELIEDENIAIGIMFGCFFIAVAIIIAAAIK